MNNKSVCVYCGADEKLPSDYKQAAFILGQRLAEHDFSLITGGGNTGLMKQVNDGHAQSSQLNKRYGVIPTIFKDLGVEHPAIPEQNLKWVDFLYERLSAFYALGQDIIVLPGGFGTLHELIDCLIHSQFGYIKKRIYLLNIDNFWSPLIEQFKLMVKKQTLQQKHLDHLIIVLSVEDLIEHILSDHQLELSQGFADRHWEASDTSE